MIMHYGRSIAPMVMAAAVALAVAACATTPTGAPAPAARPAASSTSPAAANTPASANVPPTVSAGVATTPATATPPLAATTTGTPAGAPQSANSTPPPPVAPAAPGPDGYLDDRSNAETLMRSYANALTRHEYLRAYSYWEASPQLPGFSDYEKTYAATASVEATLGSVGGDAGAGQLYSVAPVMLKATQKDGTAQTTVACYTLHLAQPAVQRLPFRSWSIQSSAAATGSASPTDQIGQVCQTGGVRQTTPGLPQASSDPADISAERYLDDRTDAVQVIRSLFNAVNRKEYGRAYTYWETPAGAQSGLPPYEQFVEGYKQTAAVALTMGQATGDPGAGQLYYTVPVALTATMTDGATQRFVGCYSLHLSQPSIQGTPPFRPLAIRSASLQEAPAGAGAAPPAGGTCR
ncbi:MAG: hypothetical protein NTZ05_10190 [Chloroflexi bacterium]|nr:hypothetical protein [Chloroflexota bacterium]